MYLYILLEFAPLRVYIAIHFLLVDFTSPLSLSLSLACCAQVCGRIAS